MVVVRIVVCYNIIFFLSVLLFLRPTYSRNNISLLSATEKIEPKKEKDVIPSLSQQKKTNKRGRDKGEDLRGK